MTICTLCLAGNNQLQRDQSLAQGAISSPAPLIRRAKCARVWVLGPTTCSEQECSYDAQRMSETAPAPHV